MPIAQTDLTGASPWQLVPSLLTSRYFLPTLPGIELNLNAQPVQWIYRHSVPVLDEAYAEVSESQSNRLANTGNVEGRDFTRVQGTEAFTLLPSTSPSRALGWLHKTTSNLEGAVEIEIVGDDTTLRKQLQGRHPQFEFKLINPKTGDRTKPISFSRDVKTSGGLQIPLQVTTSAGTRLPEFTVGIETDEEKQKLSRYHIANNGQPLIAKFDETLQRVVTLDGEGLVQQEAISEENAYRLLYQSEQRRITKRFTLGSGLQLDVIGIPLGEFSPTDDLYQQSWMLHDGNGSLPRLGGFPLYPLLLREISQAADETTIKLEAVWLYETPPSTLTNPPSNAGGKIALTFVGSGSVWKLTAVGQIDWRFSKPDNTDSPPHLARLQAQLKPQQPSELEEFNFENLKVTLDLPVGLVSLAAPSDATCKILPVELGQTQAGVLRFEIPASGGDAFQFRIGTTDIQADGKLPTLDDYSFTWTGSTAKTANPQLSDSANFVTQGDRGLGISDWQLDEYVRRLQPLPNSDSDDSEAGQPSAQGASENLSQSPVTSAQSQSVDSPQLPPRETLWDLTKGAIDALTKDTLEDTNEESPPSEGAVFVPGTAGKRVLTTLTAARNADYANEFGLFRVDNTQGYIGILKPGDLGYAQAALAPERRLLTFKATQTEATVKLPGAKFIGAYLIQNSTTVDFLKQNPTNQPEKQPLAFWSFKAANPDNLEHVKIQQVDGGVQLGWEDLAWSSDSDFDDLIVTMQFKPPQPDTELRWKLKFTSSSNWSLDIGRSDDDLTAKALVSLQLTPSRVGAHQFIFTAKNQSSIESSANLPENSWFKRLDEHSDRGFVGVEFEGFQRGVVAVKSLVADLQLRLTDKGDSSTRLVLRLMLNLSNADPSKRFEVEAAGQLTLKNAIYYQTVSPKTAPVEAIHRAKFYFDRAKIPAEAMFQILRGDGPDESVILGGIADHEFNFGNGVTYHWQAPQTVRFMQLEQFVATFLGKPSDRPTEIVLFELEKHQIERDDQIQALSKVLQILQDNPESTADIKGYTDNSASSDFNQTVSELRAATVRDWLTNQGVDEKRLNVEGLGDSNPRADNKTRPGRAQNRRVEIIIHTIALPEIPAGRESRLVVEAGAVFEVKMPKNPKTGKVTAIVPDLENEFIRLGLRPRPIEQLDTAESHASHIVRLPLAAFRNDDQTRPIWPTIELKKPDQSPSAELIYRTSGIQKQIKSPPTSFDSDRLSTFDIFNRTPQARWLESGYLRNAIVWQSDDQTPPVELQPAFWSQGEVTLRFPSTLGDLEWLRDSNLVQNPTTEVTAATLVTAYDPDNPGVPVLSRPTLFEYPFTVEDVTEIAAKLLPASTIDVQLIIFSNGLLQRIARDRIASKANIKQWASNLLQAKRRYDAAVVLKNFDQEIISIPRPFEALREELTHVPSWSLAQPNEGQEPDREDLDPRCRLPQLDKAEAPHLDTRFILNPDPSLGLLVFDASPQIPPEKSRLKSVAATRFRLAPTGANPQAFAGKLRPARIPAANSGELLACTKWDEVVFEQCNPQSSAVPAYPKVNPRPIANRPFLPSNFPKSEEDKKTGITSLLPPLIDVVAWASRPGEMTRSLWYLNGFSYPQGNNQPYQLSASQAVSVSLRRPRSVAGLDESVRLKVESTQPIFNQQFYYARLLMTQVLGKTPAPSDRSCYGVLVSKNNFYPFTTADAAKAKSSPALFYYKKNDKTLEELERIELFLLAKEDFQPVEYQDATRKQAKTRTVLLAVEPEPDLFNPFKLALTDEDFDKFDQPTAPNSKVLWYLANLDVPTKQGTGWNQLDNSKTYKFQVPNIQERAKNYISSKLLTSTSNGTPTAITIKIVLVRYQREKDKNIWNPETIFFVASAAFLDQGSAIVAPKLGLALLSSPKDKPNESVVLSGYGRLDDDDFSPIKPAAATTQNEQTIEWTRTARLQTLDRINPEVLREPPYSNDKVVYDVVLYGSGGELIPITEPN
ncbi:MAG: OmpA family protein [Cyanobacteriota bacterium]